eukprot:augustus_masked-scaffold_12-processed-gene-3.4-mRNA-1 protein AED:0.12 eAED:0.14 QI:0/-1/0/1/-1/1/1/0/734
MGRKRGIFKNGAASYHKKRKERRKMQKAIEDGSLKPENKEYDTTRFTTNALYEEYYKEQLGLADSDYQDLLGTMRKDLPATFRLSKNSIFYHGIKTYLENFSSPAVSIEKIPWSNDAYKLSVSRKELRKTKDETVKSLHKFLVREAKTENITRQEEVSMLPPILLDIKPNHRVLDTCAAPGSKTAQMIEFLSTSSNGYLVANDCDAKRAYMLHHQLKRFKTFCANLVITNLEAQFFPKKLGDRELEFDRILCDVPCSGDGTLRKNPDIWRTFTTAQTLALHPLQIGIAMKAAKLLAVGGKLVYSTCSLSPIENEAVIAQLLRVTRGCLEIEKVELEGLKSRKGLSKWKVATTMSFEEEKEEKKELFWWKNVEEFEEFRKENKPRKFGGKYNYPKKLFASMFSPSEEEVGNLNLDKCLRILPQDQNTGGFFICVLRKTKKFSRWFGPLTNLTCEEQKEVKDVEKKKDFVFKSDRIKKNSKYASYEKIEDVEFLNLKESFDVEKDLKKQLICRKDPQIDKNKEEKKKTKNKVISFCNKRIINDFIDDAFVQQRLNILSCGVPLFKRNDRFSKDLETKQEKYRLASDGINLVAKLVLNSSQKTLKISLTLLVEFLEYCLFRPKSKDAKLGKNFCPGIPAEKLGNLGLNVFRSFIFALQEEDEKIVRKKLEVGDDVHSLYVVVWRSKSTFSPLVSLNELEVLYEQILNHKLVEKRVTKEEDLEAYYIGMNQIRLNKNK